MHLNPVFEKYQRPKRDVDAEQFWDAFLVKAPARVLDVGCNDSYVANMLADMGYDVTGIDLRPYGIGGQAAMDLPCNYYYIQGDFLKQEQSQDVFDAIISLSAIEHFGLQAYGEDWADPAADTRAMALIRQLLKPGGRAYITVPYGREFTVVQNGWRVYSRASLPRLTDGFHLMYEAFFVNQGINTHGFKYEQGDELDLEEADALPTHPPHGTVLLVLTK